MGYQTLIVEDLKYWSVTDKCRHGLPVSKANRARLTFFFAFFLPLPLATQSSASRPLLAQVAVPLHPPARRARETPPNPRRIDVLCAARKLVSQVSTRATSAGVDSLFFFIQRPKQIFLSNGKRLSVHFKPF